ncbi:YARHG domain-containing protein [Breznakiella homolactica]|uniref:YARHG domain-containing protein n=1 Tax=Breznakiella homolactica TaxID=2798577 RepID=A0A7T8BBA5_9SPIR|nr:YARHG domain-containing protein [Breznakiella homolactica]QQO10352.1 YARHG domain-containing protein [Breznakiella homolactica]
MLELIKEEVFISFHENKYFPSDEYVIQAEYTIKNNSKSDTRLSVGLLFYNWEDRGNVPPIPDGVEFWVNSEKKEYKSELAEERLKNDMYPFPDEPVYWAVIDCVFPAQEKTIIKVKYINGMSGSLREVTCGYNNTMFTGLNLPEWKGIPEFSINISNNLLAINNVLEKELFYEFYWISNVMVTKKYDRMNPFDLNDELLFLQTLHPGLYSLKKNDNNNWQIQFTNTFVENYGRDIVLFLKIWGSTPQYCYLGQYPNNIIQLGHFPLGSRESKISERYLGPYELIFLTNNQLRIMRNIFYAQYGYIFQDEELFDAFKMLINWPLYKKNESFSENMLTDIDRVNIETIRKLENLKP